MPRKEPMKIDLSNVQLPPPMRPDSMDDWIPIENSLTADQVKVLRMGAVLLVYGCVEFGYWDVTKPRQRIGVTTLYDEPIYCYFVGYGKRYEGIKFPESGGRDYWGEDDYEPASFKASKQVFVVKLRQYADSKEFDALPEQCTMEEK